MSDESWIDRERDRTRNHAVVSFTRSEYAAMLDVFEAAEVVSHENSPAENWDRLDAALTRLNDLIGDNRE